MPRHCNFNPKYLKLVHELDEVVLRNLGNTPAKRIIQMIKEVYKEAYRAKQFTRTEINDRGILYGVVNLKHRVMDLVLLYFHDRWPQCVICLYNEYDDSTGIIDEMGIIKQVKEPLKKVIDQISINRPLVPYFNDIQFSGKEIFETLYKTQNIKERENPHFFKQMIPDKCFDLPGLRNGVEKNYSLKNKKIDEYFK